MRNTHILIINGHSPVDPYIQKTLQAEGFQVVFATDTQNALAQLGVPDWAAIIVNGRSTSPEVKTLIASVEKSATPHVLAICSSPEKTVEDEMRALGVKHFLSEPFAFQELLATVHAIVEESETTGTDISLDTLVVDTKERTAERNGKPITLTKKEFTLLAYLMKYRNQAVSRSDLLEHVWGMQIDPLSNTIEAHILSLRRKIDFPGQTKLIHTVPKFGYRLSVHK